jgi:hypothetical protein
MKKKKNQIRKIDRFLYICDVYVYLTGGLTCVLMYTTDGCVCVCNLMAVLVDML